MALVTVMKDLKCMTVAIKIQNMFKKKTKKKTNYTILKTSEH